MIYDTAKWEHIRKSVLRRDGYRCQECKRYGKAVSADHVHHIFPYEHYPEYVFAPWNLISLCRSCHNSMHDRDTHELSEKGVQLLERTRRKAGVPL